MKNRCGVTMVILVATVVIAVVVMSVSVISINNAVRNAEITAVTEEYTAVKKAVEEYYLLNGELPYLEQTHYSRSQIATMSTHSPELSEEIDLNNEPEDTYFVKVSLKKIGVEDSVRGNNRIPEGANLNSASSDIYVVAYPSLNVYYLAGVEIGDKYYFSLINLSKAEDVASQNNDAEKEEEFISGDLSVKKKKNTWTSDLNIEISTFINDDESLHISIPDNSGGTIVKNITVNKNATNIIKINDLTDVGFSSSESQMFKQLSAENKKIMIIKKNLDTIVGKVEVEMSNYETVAPVIGETLTRESYPQYNTFTFDVSDNASGVDVLKYEYYEKRTDLENSVLYDDNTYTAENLIKSGKVVKVRNNKVTLKIPKNVVSIKYVILDKAGNSTETLTLDTKYPLFIGYSTVSGTKNSITFNISVEAPGAIQSVKTYISNDGVTYTSEYDHGSVNNISNFTYLDISNMYDYLFIKVVAVSDGITETRVIQVNVSDFVSEGTTDKSKVKWDSPYIPDGFVHTEGTVLTGYVIQDITNTSNKYNEFVWIPVDYIYQNTTLAKENVEGKTKMENLLTGWGYNEASSTQNSLAETIKSNYNITVENEEYEKVVQSVEKYGGFYVARYEAGDLNAVEGRTSSSSNSNKVVSKKGSYVYNFIGLNDDVNVDTMIQTQTGGAIELSRNMYIDSQDISSCLMYGCQYDAILHFANLNGYNVSNSNGYGNYTDTLIKTGSNESTKILNIYDLAGNVAEWTMETDNNISRIIRGGAITNDAALNPVSCRLASIPNNLSNMIGFRPVLYIK